MDFIQTRVFTPLLPLDPTTKWGSWLKKKLAKKLASLNLPKKRIGKLGKNKKVG